MDKIKVTLKYSFASEPRDIFMALTEPDYLQNWIAEQVDLDKVTGVYTFHWGSSTESAKIDEAIKDQYVRWKWVDGDHGKDEYMSFRIDKIEDDDWVDLHVEDFCEKLEEEGLREEWNEQMERLESVLR